MVIPCTQLCSPSVGTTHDHELRLGGQNIRALRHFCLTRPSSISRKWNICWHWIFSPRWHVIQKLYFRSKVRTEEGETFEDGGRFEIIFSSSFAATKIEFNIFFSNKSLVSALGEWSPQWGGPTILRRILGQHVNELQSHFWRLVKSYFNDNPSCAGGGAKEHSNGRHQHNTFKHNNVRLLCNQGDFSSIRIREFATIIHL